VLRSWLKCQGSDCAKRFGIPALGPIDQAEAGPIIREIVEPVTAIARASMRGF